MGLTQVKVRRLKAKAACGSGCGRIWVALTGLGGYGVRGPGVSPMAIDGRRSAAAWALKFMCEKIGEWLACMRLDVSQLA